MRAAFGAGATSDFSDSSLAKLRDTYKMVEGHFVSPNLSPYADIATRLHNHGMKAIYNVEMAVWVNTGMNVGYDLTPQIPALDAIKAAGWEGSVCEGISQKQVSILHPRLPFINEGGEGGEDVYASGSMYYRPRTMAYGNYHECYHKGVNYTPAISSGNQSTPKNMGLTLMMYTTGELYYPDPQPLIAYIDSLKAQGININTILFWVGSGQSIIPKLDGQFNYLWQALNNKYGFDGGSGGIDTNINLSAGSVSPVIGQNVTFTATLTANDAPLVNVPVKIWHNQASAKYDDITSATDAKGQVVYTTKFSSTGLRQYYAEFAGNDDYNASISGVINVNVKSGMKIEGVPAACSQDALSLDIFARGQDKAMYWRHWDGTNWGDWISLGGVLSSDPAAVSRAKGKMDVFVRGTDASIWSINTTDGGKTWSAWYRVGGVAKEGASPSASSTADIIDIYVFGEDGNLWHKRCLSDVWLSWNSISLDI